MVRRREKWLACAGIRFLRTCITSKDDFYTRSIVKSHIFEPVMAVFFENGDRYNLLNSAVSGGASGQGGGGCEERLLSKSLGFIENFNSCTCSTAR